MNQVSRTAHRGPHFDRYLCVLLRLPGDAKSAGSAREGLERVEELSPRGGQTVDRERSRPVPGQISPTRCSRGWLLIALPLECGLEGGAHPTVHEPHHRVAAPKKREVNAAHDLGGSRKRRNLLEQIVGTGGEFFLDLLHGRRSCIDRVLDESPITA